MTTGEMTLFRSAAKGILCGTLPGLNNADLTAHVLKASASPDASTHQTLADLGMHEVLGGGVGPRAITGVQVLDGVGEEFLLKTDPIIFGDPVTTPPFRYLVLAYGLPAEASNAKALLAYSDLSTEGGAVEVVRGALEFNSDASGWIRLTY